MPIYEYRCESCGHELDKLQSFSDEPLVTCPACDADELKRLISQTSFHLKGSGWYVTDYKKGGKTGSTTAASSDSKSNGDGASSSSTKSEPAAKSDSGSSATT